MSEQTAAEPDAANSNAPPGGPLTPEQTMQAATARIAELEAELAEMKDRWMRAEAEIANVRARARRRSTTPASTRCRNSPPTWSRRPRTCSAASTACRRRRPDRAGDRGQGPRGPRRRRTQLRRQCWSATASSARTRSAQPFDPNLHQAMAEQESETPPARHGHAGLDPGLDPERPAAASGHGGRRQGPDRRNCAGRRPKRHRLDATRTPIGYRDRT